MNRGFIVHQTQNNQDLVISNLPWDSQKRNQKQKQNTGNKLLPKFYIWKQNKHKKQNSLDLIKRFIMHTVYHREDLGIKHIGIHSSDPYFLSEQQKVRDSYPVLLTSTPHL